MRQANEHEARELALFATNESEIYSNQAEPIIHNLARKAAKGVYDEALALRCWERLADSAAKCYAAEYCGPEFDVRQFSKETRLLAAQEIAAYYADHISDYAALYALDAKHRRMWPLANIARANEDAGHFYFSRDTMRFFGDTMASFKPRYELGKIYIERVRPNKMGQGLGKRAEFNPDTGAIK